MGAGAADQCEERCAASGTRRFSGCCVPRMLRSAPHFAAWCAADPGSIYPSPNGSRLCGAAQSAAPRPGHEGSQDAAFPGCCAARRTLRRGALLIRGPSIQVRMGPGAADQCEERCAASGTRRFSGCCVPRMLRSAPHFAAWCAADPGSIYPGPNGSRRSPGRHVERLSLSCGASLLFTDLPDRQFFKQRVQPPLQKYSVFPKTQISCISPAVPSHSEGRLATSRTRGGMRWTRRRA